MNSNPPRNRPKRPSQKTRLQTRIIDSRSREPASTDRTVFRVRQNRSLRKALAVWVGRMGGRARGSWSGMAMLMALT